MSEYILNLLPVTEEEKQEFLACAGTFRRLLSKLESGGRAK